MSFYYILFFLHFFSIFARQNIVIKSISHHEGSKNNDTHIELGTIITIFSENTIPTVLNKSQDDTEITTSLLFPNVFYSSEKRADFEKTISGQGYTFSIEEITKPHKGLLCSISYSADDVSLIYESIKNSSGKSGYLFRFINKNALKKLDAVNKSTPLIVLAKNESPRIMIDPGHGGRDFGACSNGLIEKELALLVSKRVVHQLRSDGYDVLLTRSHDQDVTLADRTTMANEVGADVYISIHANAAQNIAAHGIETFFYDSTHETQLHISDLKTVALAYQEYSKNKTKEAEMLAHTVQKTLCKHANPSHSDESINRRVKKGAFQVLMGPIAPAILIEIGFISNQKEAEELKKKSYQRKIAQGICAGIKVYFKEKAETFIA